MKSPVTTLQENIETEFCAEIIPVQLFPTDNFGILLASKNAHKMEIFKLDRISFNEVDINLEGETDGFNPHYWSFSSFLAKNMIVPSHFWGMS